MYSSFYDIAKKLNHRFTIIPLLYGSLGLQLLIKDDLHADDVDVLIPRSYLNEKWTDLLNFMQDEGYSLIDLHEHTFKKDNIKMAFAEIDSLEEFAQIDLTKSTIMENSEAKFRLLNLEQYLNVYLKSSKDSYRNNKNNDKDLEKIRLIRRTLEGTV